MKNSMRSLARPASFCFAAAFLLSGIARAQGHPSGFWTAPDANAAHTNWQKAERQISTDTVTNGFKFLWKLKLGTGHAKSASFTEPLLYPGLITGKGFKDMALLADQNTVYSVDSELGELIWKKDFPGAHSPCGNLQIITEPPPVIHFGPPPSSLKPGSAATPVPPRRPPEPPLPRSQRRVGASPGGGYFGLRGVYVVTSDGYIHEQIMATGLDYAPPVKFLPTPMNGSSFGLNINDKVVYTETGSGCRDSADAVASIDLNTANYPVSSYNTQKLGVHGLTGPAIGQDGTAYVATGSGPDNPAAGLHANSVVALTAGALKVKDWYTPKSKMMNTGPVVFNYKGKELIAAPGNAGIVLLDAQSLGGPDHHTPLAESIVMAKAPKRGAWEALAAWQDKDGVPWIFASIDGPVAKFPGSNGPAAHGSIVAFKVEEMDGHTALTPVWISRDLLNPAPPAVANGVVFALDGGDASHHATLYALDAATGKQLYSSEDAIQTYTHLAGMSIGDGHVFFTTHDNTLYSFGIPLEH
jgi:outer membrane protein assembly factor BamB